MKKKMINKEVINGRVFSHTLALKKTGSSSTVPGTEYINGTLEIATDEECLNVISVYFPFVTRTTKSGGTNNTFTTLNTIMTNGKTVVVDGKENATMVKVNTSLGLNEFYSDRNGNSELVSAKRNENGYVTIVNKLDDEDSRNLFEFDMLIDGVRRIETDPERNINEDYLMVKGAIFNYRNEMLPVELPVRNEGGIKFFEDLDPSPSNLIFTKVWGKINSQTIVDRREEESAFGEPSVKEYSKNIKEWLITGTSKKEAMYEIGDEENGITLEEVKKLKSDYEIRIADVKKKQEEYQAKRNATTAPVSEVAVAESSFNF